MLWAWDKVTHYHPSRPVMHNVQGTHVSHFPYKELGDVNQLQTNIHHHGVTQTIQLMLLYCIAQ